MAHGTNRPRRARSGAASSASSLPMPRALVTATTTADVVTVPARTVLAVEGVGAPEGGAFQRSVAAIYGIAYTLKFARKRSGKADFKIGPLEGRWWTEEPGRLMPEVPRETWRWELRLGIPGAVTEREVGHAVAAATEKKGGKLEGSVEARRVTLARLPATTYGRVLHVGPYGQEGESFGRIAEHLGRAGHRAGNAHIEVYLSDPRRTAPEKLKTALLQELAS